MLSKYLTEHHLFNKMAHELDKHEPEIQDALLQLASSMISHAVELLINKAKKKGE
jgi:hypothetical protein